MTTPANDTFDYSTPVTRGPSCERFFVSSASDSVSNFDQYFELVPANTKELQEDAFRLRFEVYCEQLNLPGFEPERFPSGLESDAHDKRSEQCLLLHRPSGDWAGVVRLVLADPAQPTEPFPTELFAGPNLDTTRLSGIDRREIGEISRLIVSKNFRRRWGEAKTAYGGTDSHLPLPVTGLLAGVMGMAAKNDVKHLLAILDPVLNRLLRRLGVELTRIGPPVFASGRRVPCFGSISDVLANAEKVNPDAWSIIVGCGTR
jgi:N-acyl amino acid synthase of PEP-CTERM/exosortase system